MIGDTISGYKIVHKIGEGGMGEVYYAIGDDGLKVAIKRIRDEFAYRPDIVSRFKVELQSMIKLQGHPNIIELKSLTTSNSLIIMEYLEGEDLYSYVKSTKSPVEEERLLKWMESIISALEYAHSNSIIHRDIKPSNIFLTRFGVIKVLDFGIAKVVQETEDGEVDSTLAETLTKTRSSLGAPQFMSPEQLYDPRMVTHLSDIYSFGKTIKYLATGGNPMVKLSERLSKIVDRATKDCPEDRYRSISDILNDMKQEEQNEQCIEEEGIEGEEPLDAQQFLLGVDIYMEALEDLDNDRVDEALGKLIEAAELDIKPAKYILSQFYLNQDSPNYNPEVGISLLSEAAIADVKDAQYDLGYCYEYGLHTINVDIFKAKEWYENAALNGSEEAAKRVRKTKFWYI